MNVRRQLERLAFASFTEAECPPAESIAAYALGQLHGNDHLRVAAHVRECPLCTYDVSVLRPPAPPPKLKRLILQPFVQAALGVRRSSGAQANVRTFRRADVEVQLTIAPPDEEAWRITGQVLRGGHALADREVTLRRGRQRQQTRSDADGFFTFDDLPSGKYTLSVIDGDVQIQIQALQLTLD